AAPKAPQPKRKSKGAPTPSADQRREAAAAAAERRVQETFASLTHYYYRATFRTFASALPSPSDPAAMSSLAPPPNATKLPAIVVHSASLRPGFVHQSISEHGTQNNRDLAPDAESQSINSSTSSSSSSSSSIIEDDEQAEAVVANLTNDVEEQVGGVMAARLGTATTSVIATSLILLGQLILFLGDYTASVRLMVVGLFVFGLGISPLAVVQETIIVRFFCKHGLGVSLALGLVAGKLTSFVSAYTSFPLSRSYGPHAPFVVSTLLSAISFGFNIVYLLGSNWFTRGAGLAPEAAECHKKLEELRDKASGQRMSEQEALEKVAAKRNVKLKDLTKLGDVFWLYTGINVLCGAIWSPFTHLAANIFEKRYSLTELEASEKASLLLAGSIILYPLCGFLTDRLKKGPIVHHLFLLSSALTLFCYFWLVLPPSWTGTPMPAIVTFGGGHGFSTLLLVIIVPHLVPIQYVSTALGTHKSLESVGSTMSKILAGLLLDSKSSKKAEGPSMAGALPKHLYELFGPPIDNFGAIQWLLNAWFLVNLLQMLGVIVLWKMDVHRKSIWNRSTSGFLGRQHTFSSDSGYIPLPAEADDRGAPSTLPHPPKGDSVSITGQNPWLDLVDEDAIEESPTAPPSPTTQTRYPNRWSTPLSQTPFLIPNESDSSPWPHRSGARFTSYTTPQPSKSRDSRHHNRTASFTSIHGVNLTLAHSRRERRRGKLFFLCSFGLVLATWALFFATALAKISEKEKSLN
ncbi:hypothetical protein FRB99_001282, partial [Tulasnella sp. 403]